MFHSHIHRPFDSGLIDIPTSSHAFPNTLSANVILRGRFLKVKVSKTTTKKPGQCVNMVPRIRKNLYSPYRAAVRNIIGPR